MSDKIIYSEMVTSLLKPGADIHESMTSGRAMLLHLALGIAGEAGEIVDAIKKHTIYGQPLNYDNMLEELGDMEFYMEGLRQAVFFTREQCLQSNIDKLGVRYKGLTYSDKSAQDRADKA
jgi:hypothetical protein